MVTGRNITFPIYIDVGGAPQSFMGLVLRKATVDSTVMSLGDKITGDVYYTDNRLPVSMKEYIVYNGVRYELVNPPTIVREGLVSENSDLRGMTKYSFEFYHPMWQLGNMAFTDVAVSEDEEKYLSESKTFSWIGRIEDFAKKLNKNLRNTEWVVVVNNDTITPELLTKLSEVLTFDNSYISDALKTAYDTWKVPFVIDTLQQGEYSDIEGTDYYEQGKRFVILFGLPSNEIYETDSSGNIVYENDEPKPFVFRYGQGVGLKNRSRTPKNNKIVTRIAGYGSETNIPYGYPQIEWKGNQEWSFTINNTSGIQEVEIGGQTVRAMSYPIYDGIVGGKVVRLIKHPFTRKHLMPPCYRDTLNRKVNPLSEGYDPNIELIDHYDADASYPNPINEKAPSCEIHKFADVKPELGEAQILGAVPYDEASSRNYMTADEFSAYMDDLYSQWGRLELGTLKYNVIYNTRYEDRAAEANAGKYYYKWSVTNDNTFFYVKYESEQLNFEVKVAHLNIAPSGEWIDDFDDEGNYLQSYFEITLPQLEFDIYACAAITQEMQINMRGGACIGCTFTVQVDWEDYKKVFYDTEGNFVPDGEERQRRLADYPYSNKGSIAVLVQKETETFGKLMPNVYQVPKAGDAFVILGISLPTSYIANAEKRLEGDMKEYMLENNIYHFEYPLKFDEFFLANNLHILEQIRNNTIVRFLFREEHLALYIKQITIKYGDKPLPEYNITLTDDVEIVLNQIGQVTDDVSRVRVQLSELQKYYTGDVSEVATNKLSRVSDDTANGHITFAQGLTAQTATIGQITTKDITTPDFVSGATGARLWRDGGYWKLEVDDLNIRRKISAREVQIESSNYIDGATVLSGARIVCTRVELVTATGQQPALLSLERFVGARWYYADGRNFLSLSVDMGTGLAYRCYFEKTDEDGTEVYNKFQVGDLAYCQTFNLTRMSDGRYANQYYWREVVGVGVDFIDLARGELDESGNEICDGVHIDTGSLPPMAGDKIVQRGNVWNADRQTVLELAGSGSGAPYIRALNNIDSFAAISKVANVSFKLDGKDNYIKGDILLESFGWATDFLDDMTTSLGYAGIQLNGAQSSITLSADTTKVTDGQGRIIAVFSTTEGGDAYIQTSLIKASELEIQRVTCLDTHGNKLRTINEMDDGLDKYYYPGGNILMEQQWITDSEGKNVGIKTIHYDKKGNPDWEMSMDGKLTILTAGAWIIRHSKTWAATAYIGTSAEATYGNLLGNILTVTNRVVADITSTPAYAYDSGGIAGYAVYDGLVRASADELLPSDKPDATTEWFTGYAMAREWNTTTIVDGRKQRQYWRSYVLYIDGVLIDTAWCKAHNIIDTRATQIINNYKNEQI